jgi:hypothetical protein
MLSGSPSVVPRVARGTRQSISGPAQLVADLDLRTSFEAPILDLEADRAVENQRRAVGAVGRALDRVEASLAEVVEHAVDQQVRDALAVHLRPPEGGQDTEGQPVPGAGPLGEAALVVEHLRNRAKRARVGEQDPRHEAAQEPEVPAHGLSHHGVREPGVEVVARPLVLEAEQIPCRQAPGHQLREVELRHEAASELYGHARGQRGLVEIGECLELVRVVRVDAQQPGLGKSRH